MAFPTYQSNQNTTSGSGSVAPAKPTSLAVGDVMIGWVIAEKVGGPTINTPTGWTLINSDTAAATTAAAAFWKIADANDVAASTFTFTSDGVAMMGAVIRIATDNSGTPVEGATHATSLTVGGFTPVVGNGLFLILTGHRSSISRTMSSYAIANNNPTWTEAFDGDFATSIGDFIGISMAYANRGALTATGSATASLSGAGSDFYIQFISIIPALPAPLAINETLNRPVTPIFPSPFVLTGTVNSPTFLDTAKKWSNTSKSSTTWTNTSKTS